MFEKKLIINHKLLILNAFKNNIITLTKMRITKTNKTSIGCQTTKTDNPTARIHIRF